MKTEVLRMENVTTKNGEQTLLEGVSLRICAGDITGLLPVNTFGLEGLLEILLYNAPVYYGHIYYCEKCINSWKEEKKTRNPITLIDGKKALVEGMSVADNLCVFRPGREELIRKSSFRAMAAPYLYSPGISGRKTGSAPERGYADPARGHARPPADHPAGDQFTAERGAAAGPFRDHPPLCRAGHCLYVRQHAF